LIPGLFPKTMQEKTLKTLEFDKIVQRLQKRCHCCVSREMAEALEPSERMEEVERLLRLTSEAETILYRLGHGPVEDFPDTRSCLKRVHAALFLNPGELLNIASCLRASRLAKDAVSSKERGEQVSLLANLAEGIQPHRSVEEEITRCIMGEEEIADGASPALARIRRSMRQANEKVREKLNSMIHSASYAKYLQEPIITIRNGRFVLPVKQEYRQNIPGLVHDQSGSGATLFIEPSAVVELGNTYKKLQSEEAEEIERILTELTAMVAPIAGDLYENLMLLGEIDLYFAKAALGRDMRAVCPKLNQRGYLYIVRGRHPLIDPEKVVPIDVWLGKDFHTLVLTGPNTGGKTVTLKTIGLFTLMAQAGLFIPAETGSELSVFEEVFADIGDEQSIEQSLSTFSSHMSNVVDILKKADERSLVLLDELGAGTDPIEGAALAMSILEDLHARRTRTAATTHYSEIKAFALTRDGMENASMEFDVDKLAPTYRLFIGIPGKSNAFEISRRLGISETIIESARQFLESEDVKFEDVISMAESQRALAEEEKRMAEAARKELDALRAATEAERKKLEAEKAKYQNKAREDARKIVAETKATMDRLVKQVHALKNIDMSAADRVIQKSRDELRAAESKLSEPVQKAVIVDPGHAPKTVRPGDRVKIVSLDKEADVLSAPDAKKEVQVQAGIIKLSVKLSDLRLLKSNAANSGSTKVSLNTKRVGLELDVRGMMVNDAIIVVDRYLDDAAMAGLNEVNIIHGKGTGALRAGLQEHFRRSPRVKSFRLGNYGEGDAGVTVVSLRK